MSDDPFEEAVEYAQMLSSDDCKDEVGSHVYEASNVLTDESLPKEQRISNAEDALKDSLTRRDHDEYREGLRNSYVQDPLDLAMAVSRFDTLVHDLSTSINDE